MRVAVLLVGFTISSLCVQAGCNWKIIVDVNDQPTHYVDGYPILDTFYIGINDTLQLTAFGQGGNCPDVWQYSDDINWYRRGLGDFCDNTWSNEFLHNGAVFVSTTAEGHIGYCYNGWADASVFIVRVAPASTPDPIEQTIQIFPNPTSSSIRVLNATSQKFNYRILNAQGQSCIGGDFTGSVQIDLSTFISGAYFFIGWNDQGVIRKRILKL